MKVMIILVSCTILLSAAANAQKSAVFVKDSVAINGYDPVAYFTEARPVKGSREFAQRWNNADWYFSTKANLDAFILNPEKYAPQFGGYCAFGMADGHKAPTEPGAWTIVNGKLYLNYNTEVLDLWKKQQAKYIKSAESNWPVLKDKE